MTRKPTYKELEQKIKKLEKENGKLKEAEEELNRYQFMIESAHDAIFFKDLGSCYISANDKTVEAFGLSKEDVIGKNDYELMPDQKEAEKNVHDDQIVFKSGKPTEVIKHMTGVDGKEYWFQAKKVPQFDNDGNVIGLVGIARNITDRKRAEEALRKSESMRRGLFLTTPIGIAVVNDRTFIDVNNEYCNIVGYNKNELIGNTTRMLYETEDESARVGVELYTSLWSQGFTSVGTRHIRKNGDIRDIMLRAAPILSDDASAGVVVAIEDITERKKMEEALRESEEKYRTILETSLDPIIVYDMEGKMTYFNPAFTRIFGWNLEERLGKKMDFFVPDDAWPETQQMIEKVLAGESLSGFETRRYTKEGDIIQTSMSAAIYKDIDDNPVGSVINLRDITEQKKLENQLQQVQKMESLGTLAGGIAHDFNNLLMGIQGRASLILMDIDSSHPHFEHLAEICEYVKSAEQLTKQLLGFARSGKYEVKSVDINVIVEKSSKMFGRTKKEIRVHRKNQENIWVVKVDPGQIEQALLNLYVNAWHAMPGGGDLNIQTENVIIDENYIKPYQIEIGKYVKISVTDNGIGMDEETQQRIFEPFFTTKEMGRGTGLGLASVYGIIKNHDGFINVYSEKGVGTTFNFYLPASKDQVLEQEKVLCKTVLKCSDTILLVDDEDLIIDVSQNILKLFGYNVLTAKGGREAIQVYKKNQDKIDMVILDMIMPGMNGGEVYNKLREINPDIKVLLSSGYSLNEQASEILERGCNDFIQKPFNMMDISEKIRKILDN